VAREIKTGAKPQQTTQASRLGRLRPNARSAGGRLSCLRFARAQAICNGHFCLPETLCNKPGLEKTHGIFGFKKIQEQIQSRYGKGSEKNMFTVILILILCLIAATIWLYFNIEKEKRRNRILQAHIAGIIRAISDYKHSLDDNENLPESIKTFPLPYQNILAWVENELFKDLTIAGFDKWLKDDRNLFYDPKYGNAGFNWLYWNLFDKQKTEIEEDKHKSEEERLFRQKCEEINKGRIKELADYFTPEWLASNGLPPYATDEMIHNNLLKSVLSYKEHFKKELASGDPKRIRKAIELNNSMKRPFKEIIEPRDQSKDSSLN
jgi:hypothetical protein